MRDGVSDHGRAAAPRLTVPHMLPSATLTASASAGLLLSRLNSPPHTIAVYASPWLLPTRRNTRYQAGATTPYLGRTSTGWITPASPGALVGQFGNPKPEHVDSFDLGLLERLSRPGHLVSGAAARLVRYRQEALGAPPENR